MYTSLVLWLSPTCATIALLLLLSLRSVWQRRRIVGELALALLLVALPFLCVSSLSLISICIFIGFHALLVLLVARVLLGRLSENFLRSSTRLNTLLSLPLLASVLGLAAALETSSNSSWASAWIGCLLIGSLAIGSLFVWQALWTLRHYAITLPTQLPPLKQLPTVTLAIPARNESPVLTDCLSAAISSDYPKLEIITLDDCSQDKTSELIRVFAHDGVRFIQGSQPADGWLGKNLALHTLAEAASGEYILFSGVDTHLAPQSISKLVEYMLATNMEMVAVLPQNRQGPSLATLLWQLRYYWQIVFPLTKHRVPIASQCWLIRADTLRRLGGFDAARNKIVVEGFFARRLFSKGTYRFIVSDKTLDITTAKRWSSQNETALRFLYPTFKRQPLFVLCACLCLVLFVMTPFYMTISLTVAGQFSLKWLGALTACLLFLASYLLVIVRALPRAWPLALIFFPVSLAVELALLIISMLAYEFGEVNWKGRNVCYPVLSNYSSTLQPRDNRLK